MKKRKNVNSKFRSKLVLFLLILLILLIILIVSFIYIQSSNTREKGFLYSIGNFFSFKWLYSEGLSNAYDNVPAPKTPPPDNACNEGCEGKKCGESNGCNTKICDGPCPNPKEECEKGKCIIKQCKTKSDCTHKICTKEDCVNNKCVYTPVLKGFLDQHYCDNAIKKSNGDYGMQCDGKGGCVECFQDSNCLINQHCDKNKCVECTKDTDCGADYKFESQSCSNHITYKYPWGEGGPPYNTGKRGMLDLADNIANMVWDTVNGHFLLGNLEIAQSSGTYTLKYSKNVCNNGKCSKETVTETKNCPSRSAINSNFWSINPSSCNGNLCIGDCWNNNNCEAGYSCESAVNTLLSKPKTGTCKMCFVLFCKT
jgi:hypothetical protein